MCVLGIDQSLTSSGICIIENDTIKHFTCIKTKKDDGDIFDRSLIIINELEQLVIEHNVSKITIEGLPFNMRSNVTRDLAGLQAVIICHCKLKFNITPQIIPPKQLKKFATESGNAKKEDMVEALPEEYRNSIFDAGYKKSTGLYDLADAYFLAKCA